MSNTSRSYQLAEGQMSVTEGAVHGAAFGLQA